MPKAIAEDGDRSPRGQNYREQRPHRGQRSEVNCGLRIGDCGFKPETRATENGGQRSEVGGPFQRSEVRGRRSELQKPEPQRAEVRGLRSEVGGQRSEVGAPEIGGPEIGGQQTVRNPAPEILNPSGTRQLFGFKTGG